MTDLFKLPSVASSQSYSPKNEPQKSISNSAAILPKDSQDSLELSSKLGEQVPTNSKTKKLFVGLGAIASTVVFGIVAVKQKKVPALEEAQKVFKDVFMRNDITLTETKQILENYKNISKIKDKEEYIRAIFKEAKKNYGFGDVEMPLNVLGKMRKSARVETMGGAHVSIDKGVDISLRSESPINAVHHELRHIKQHYLAANYSKNDYYEAVFENLYNNGLRDKNGISNSFKSFEDYYKNMSVVVDNCIMNVEKMYGSLTRSNVKPEQYEFAKKCIDNQRKYIDAHLDKPGYLNQFVEKDAYNAGDSIEKLLKKFIQT